MGDMRVRTSPKRRDEGNPARAGGLKLGSDEYELIAERLVRYFAIRLGADFALQAANSPVLGDEVHHLRPLVSLLLEPSGEGRSRRHERGHPISRVEVLALPVHLVRDE